MLIDFFATYLRQPASAVSQQMIRDTIAASGCTQDDINAWDTFLVLGARARFADRQDTFQDKEELFKHAAYWITMLEKLL